MIFHSLRASGAGALRAARKHTCSTTVSRTFAISTPRRADMVQDIYLKHLRDYRTPPTKASDAEGHVQKFVTPQAPKSPEEPGLAEELKSYNEQEVEVEGSNVESTEIAGSSDPDWFERMEDFEGEERAAEGQH